MSGEWLLVILPVAFVLGWFSARLDIRHVRKDAGQLPHAYLAGLSHLLRDETGKALDAFLKAQPMDPESAELQFSIGELSRRRGEHRRALQIHHHLCRREDLPATVRQRSFWELAQDYFQMGFLDFAESYAAPLLQEKNYQEKSLQMMMSICQRNGDYQRIIKMARDLPPEIVRLRRAAFAHLYCECARCAADDEEKRARLNEALTINPNCARARILLGDLCLSQDDPGPAAQHFLRVEKQAPQFLWLAVDGLWRAKGEAAGRDYLRWLSVHPSAMLFERVYWAMSKTAAGVADLADDELIKHHYPTAAARWIDEQTAAAAMDKRRVWLSLKKVLTDGGKKPFACDSCGYEVRDFSWQCAGCLSWESFTPRQ